MSSEYLEDVDDDEHGTTVLLSMRASGDAYLCLTDIKDAHYYHLAPDPTGWGNAEKIVAALSEWIRHTKRTNP